MVKQKVAIYVNLEKGLLYETQVGEDSQLKACTGKNVRIETFELNWITVDGVWYKIDGYQDGLAHIVEETVLWEEN